MTGSVFRVAVFSDIHGFSIALETVLHDLAEQPPVDEIVIAGDLCEVGPDPAGVIARLREFDYTVLQGNTDLDIVESIGDPGAPRSLRYAAGEIGEEGVRWLAGLPFSRRITPPGGVSPDDDLLVVHANPNDLYRRLDPAMSDRELREIIGDTRAGAIAFGHIHICYTRRLDSMLLVDVSAVGNPKDGDLRCKYGILNWDASTRSWHADIRKLSYPLEQTEAQCRSSDLPDPEKVIRKLRKASY